MKTKLFYILCLFTLLVSCNEDDLNFDAKSLVTEQQLIELGDSSPALVPIIP